MSTSTSSDSWILVALTILVVLLLFYLSKKMICNTDDGGGSDISPSTSTTSFSSHQIASSDSPSSPDSDDIILDIADSSESHHHHQRIGGNNNTNNTNNLITNYYALASRIRMDFGGSPPPPSSSPPILISIIGSSELERKTMLEAQLRNQIAKIVEAEREIQRLAQLLATDQRELDWHSYIAAARASEILSPSSASSGLSSSTPSGAEATVGRTTPVLSLSPPSPSSMERNTCDSAGISIVGCDHRHNTEASPQPPGNHQSERSNFSDFPSNSTNSQPAPHHETTSGVSCRCTLCLRRSQARMLMMRRMLSLSLLQSLPPDGGTTDFSPRSTPWMPHVHYRDQEERPQFVPDPQSRVGDPLQQLIEDNPPAYEECVRSTHQVPGESCERRK